MRITQKKYATAFIPFIISLLIGCDASVKKNEVTSPNANASPKTGSREVAVNGTNRTFILYIPKNYNAKQKTPLVIDYHGLFGNGAGHMQTSGYRELAEAEGFIVAFPNGIDSAWNIGPCCTFNRTVDEVAFAHAIAKQIESEANIDENRIYAAGFSNGGGMAQYLACHAADLFAAIAPSAFDLLQENSPTCKPSRPIPVLLTRGLKDNFVPYSGGASNPPNGIPTTIHFLGAAATFKRWAEINQCTDVPVKASADCVLHKACAANVEVGLCSVPEGGHTPGDAKTGWEFLKRFTKK